jgi:predicted amidohydrolase
LRVVCIQPKAFDLTQYDAALANILEKIDESAKVAPQLIVIPECVYPSYYLGLNEELFSKAMDHVHHVIDAISEKASKYRTYIAFGLVVKENSQLFNRGILFDPDGRKVGEVNKSFMWHFDKDWFSLKDSNQIVETPYGKWGMIICADGRMPEIVRGLALQGVDIIIDLANLTSTGKNKVELTNAQSSFMLSTRAIENNVWLVMADKVGVEANTVTYSGKSCIIAPDGNVVIEATSDKEEIIYCDINPLEKNALGTDVIQDRNIATYHPLIEDHSTLPISKTLSQNVVPSNLVIQGSCIQFAYTDHSEYMTKAQFYIQTLENQMSDVIVLPQITEEISPYQIQKLLHKQTSLVFYSAVEQVEEGSFISIFSVTKDSVEIYRKTHLTDKEKKQFQQGTHYKVIETARGNIGLMIGEEGLFPEVARILTLQGADSIVWINHFEPILQEKIARTRAAENKIFVLTSSQLNQHEMATSIVVDPNGNIIASTLEGTEHALSIQIPLVLGRCKTIVPGTNAILNRTPKKYVTLTL